MSTENEPRRVLIVDDEPGVVAYLEMLLKDHGFKTMTAGNGDEGLEKARQEKPDLITLDISMPKSSGARCLKNLKSDPDLAAIPVVVVTAVTGYAGDPYGYMDFMQKQASLPEPDGFFPKPIDKEKFIGAVRELVSGAGKAVN